MAANFYKIPLRNVVLTQKGVNGKSAQCDHPYPVEVDHLNPEQTDHLYPVQIDHPLSCFQKRLF